MKRLSDVIIQFFHRQGCVIVSTVDKNGFPHSSCKGIIDINPNGRVYLLDLYRAKTYENLKENPCVSITAIDEHKFIGYCLKGKAGIMPAGELKPDIIKAWEVRITSRLTQRLLKNIHEEKGHPRHPEILLPKPEYMITVEVEEVVDLTPHHLK
ncbi:MAG: pyridoxamine 5'-phosphate oxidase family protein [Candidatus Omnitrophota bacterium]